MPLRASHASSAASRRTRLDAVTDRILVRIAFRSTRTLFMRLFRRAGIALSIMLFASSAHAQNHVSAGLLHVNAYDDRMETQRIEAARAEQRRLDEQREEAHREDDRLEQQRLAEGRREARIAAYNAWLQRRHETRAIKATTP
jgi:hypothetical protein